MNTIDNLKKKYLNVCPYSKSEICKEPKAPFKWKNKKNIENDKHKRTTIVNWYESIQSSEVYAKYIKWYTITVSPKDPTTEVLEGQYIQALKRLKVKCKTIIDICYIFERSPQGKLHIHGILACRDRTKFLKAKHCIRYHFQMDPLTYLDGWVNYMLTDSPKEVITGF